MVINSGVENVPQQIEAGVLPAGTPVKFSDYSIRDHEGNMVRVMRDGVLVGCDELGGAHHALVQRSDDEGVPYGPVRTFTTLSLRRNVEVIYVDPDAELN